jgi:hypothetical protein
MTNDNLDEEYPLPVDHPRTAAVLGWVYEKVFEPLNNLWDRLCARFTNKLIEENTDPADKPN